MLLPRTRTETEFVEVVRLTAPGHLTPKGLSGDTGWSTKHGGPWS
ncbi:hypothetical protein [Streptomyces sp. NPDC088557]